MILPGFTSAFQSPLYIGILPLWLAVFALFANRARAIKFWALLAVGSLIVSFGFYAFGYALFYLFVPGFAIFRGQERLAFVVSFALAMLAGFGMREVLQSDVDRRTLRRVWALLPMGITISVMFVITLFVSGTVRQSGRVAVLSDRAGLMVLIFTLATVLIAARGRAFAGLALALIAFDLFSVGNAAYNADPQPRFADSPIVRAIKNEPGMFRVADENQMPGHFGIAYRVEDIGGISPLRIARYDLLRELPAEKLYPLLNVRYLITERPGFENAEVIAEQGKTRLLRLGDPMPRAWLAGAPLGRCRNADPARRYRVDGNSGTRGRASDRICFRSLVGENRHRDFRIDNARVDRVARSQFGKISLATERTVDTEKKSLLSNFVRSARRDRRRHTARPGLKQKLCARKLRRARF
ncbi:MAG: hypothetical protein HZC40_09335 [Chloroflexi bacterium]|nr:hypothetical protein [Chloroflexota bacterium]